MRHNWQIGDVGVINNRSHSQYIGAEFEVCRIDKDRREVSFIYLNRPGNTSLQRWLRFDSMDSITDFVRSNAHVVDEIADFFV